VTWQVLAVVQGALHPEKLDPAAAVAVSVTIVPELKFAVQVPGQLMPGGALVTVPLPFPEILTFKTCCVLADEVKLAVTDVFLLRARLQLFVPLQAPLQPAKVEFGAGVAVRVIWVPC
jgi:hypothetical protein